MLGGSFYRHTSLRQCSSLPAAQPVLTVTLAAWYLGQTLAGRDLAAMGLVLIGVAFVIYSKVSEDARRCAPLQCAADHQITSTALSAHCLVMVLPC